MIGITVIIPMYNPGKNIIRCINSIRKQIFEDYELLIIDDGSNDGSYKYVEKYLKNYPDFSKKVRFIRKENSGVAMTRNLGMDEANGKYIAFIDQDDFISSDYLEKYYSVATKNDSDIVVGGYERVRKDRKILKRVKLKATSWAPYIVTAPWAHLYKSDYLRKNNIRFLVSKIGEDVYFNLIAYKTDAKINVISDVGYKWFFNDKSVSNSIQNTLDNKLDVRCLLDAIYNDADTEKGYLEYYLSRYVCWYILFSARGSRKKDIVKACDELLEWLEKRFPDFRKQKYLGISMPKGEDTKTHAFVVCFYLMEKIGIIRFVLKLFGRK